ncbi:TRIM3 [Branchiostoma lanceolatum]|uniref:TRIM3 protein n=1 Tax=Branchiostoma lanceolatum TaxID=7740 RepID=A0A8K0A9X4_BRALA|nr:TRIM3 [Branchiostoma lanceolatum]
MPRERRSGIRQAPDDPTHVRCPPIGAEQQNQTVPAPPVPAPRPGGISIAGAKPVAAATHVYDGERCGMRDVPPVPPPRPGPLQPPLNRDARSVPPAPAPATTGAQTVAAATHVYEDGDTFGMRLGPPLKREARRAPAVPPTPRPGRTTDSGAQSVAASTHVYENDDTLGMRLGPPLNPDACSAPPAPSTPRPGRRTDDQTDNQNQPPDAAGERRSIWERHCQGRGIAITIIVASVVMVTLMISLLAFMVHHAPSPPDHDAPVKTTGGPDSPGNTVWQSSAVLKTVTSADVIMPVKTPGGPDTPGDTVWKSSAVLKTVTSADVIMVNPVHGHGSPAPATGLPSTDTKGLLPFAQLNPIHGHGSPAPATGLPSTDTKGLLPFAQVNPVHGHGSPAPATGLPSTDTKGLLPFAQVNPVHGHGSPAPATGLPSTDTKGLLPFAQVNPVHGHGSPAPATGLPSTDTKEVSGGGSRSQIITFGDEPGDGKLSGARAVAVSFDNRIWVVDRSKALLQVYNIKGVYLCQFPPGAPGLGHPSKRSSDLSIDKDGHIWVLMIGYPASPDSVVQVGRDGHIKANFDLPDTVPRGVLRGMAVGLRNNHVFVTWAGFYSGGVQAFEPDGKLLWEVGRMKRPMNVAVNGKGSIFVSDANTHFVYRYGVSGQYVSKFGGPGQSGGDLSYPEGICVDSSGHILVVDSLNQRVVMYTDRGRFVRNIAVRAEYPTGVAVGPGGQLVVISKNTITVFPRY